MNTGECNDSNGYCNHCLNHKETRCKAIIGVGIQCHIRRKTDSKYCGTHEKMAKVIGRDLF